MLNNYYALMSSILLHGLSSDNKKFAKGDRYGIAVTDKNHHLKDALTLKDLKGIRYTEKMSA